MTNKEVFKIAMRQSAADLQCRESDFLNEKNVIIEAGLGPNAKSYYREPIACNLISYGNNIVAATKSEYRDIVEEYLEKYEFFHCLETPNLHWLNERLEQKGQRICFMAEYYLPDLTRLQELPCDYELRLLEPEDFSSLYTKEWSNALCEDRKELDMLGVGAYNQGKLVGMAGCSADCDTMWQIGVDVLPEYRRKGIASALTSRLAVETLKRGKVPFYCTAWSNIRSARNAIKCGFLPAWVEMSAKPMEYVEELNR